MLKIYNTLGRELQEFKPIEPNKVKIYQCGPTVYSVQHIGNMRAAVLGDFVRRSFMYLGFNTVYARNITDVGHLSGDNEGDADSGEDRMEKAAKKENLDPVAIAQKYTDIYHAHINALNVMVPDSEPKATKYVQTMIKVIQDLLDKGYAYIRPNAIYFEVDKFPTYSKLSGQRLTENLEGSGKGDVTDIQKKKPYDFVLWFFKTGPHANALQTWESPFKSESVENGRGLPGWHIECSAMIRDILGETIDVHMGGVEHIPLHHTNEIAQSEASTGIKFANYWMHNEHLSVDNQKMSKSLGNVYNVDEIRDKGYNPLALRYFFLQSHYRSKQNFTWEALTAAATGYGRLANFVKNWIIEAGHAKAPNYIVDENFKQKFNEALEDDFNLPQALAVAWELTKAELPSHIKLGTMLNFDEVLGLDFEDMFEDPVSMDIPVEAKILLEERNIARIEKDFAKADKLRDELKEKFNLEVLDSKEGQSVKKIT